MDAATLDILLRTRGDFSAMRQGVEEIHRTTAALERMKERASEVASNLKMGFLGGVGFKGVETLLEIPAKLNELVQEGDSYNQQMQTRAIGIAASMRQAFDGITFAEAKERGTAAMDALRTKANDLGLDFESLTESYQINLTALVEGGVTDFNRQIELTTLLSSTMASKGISGFQAVRDTMDLLNGRANNTVVAKELGITDNDVKAAKEAGQLYEFFTTRLKAYGEAQSASADTAAAAAQRMHNAWQAALGTATEDLFEQRRKSYNALAQTMQSGQFEEGLKSILSISMDLQGVMLKSQVWLAEHGKLVRAAAEAATSFATAWAAWKAIDLLASFAAQLRAIATGTVAIEAETAALGRNTAAHSANAAARTAEAAAGGVGPDRRSAPAAKNFGEVIGTSGVPAVSEEGERMRRYQQARGIPMEEAQAEVAGHRRGEAQNLGEAAAMGKSFERASEALRTSSAAAREAETVWARLGKGVGNFIGGARGLLGKLDAGFGGLPTMLVAQYALQKTQSVGEEYAASYGYGKATNAADIENAQVDMGEQDKQIGGFRDRAAALTNSNDRSALVQEVLKYQHGIAGSIDPDGLNGASNDVAQQTVGALGKLIEQLGKLKLDPKENPALTAAIEAQHARDGQAATNRVALESDDKRLGIRDAQDALGKAADRGDVATVDKAIAAKSAELAAARKDFLNPTEADDSKAGAKAGKKTAADIGDLAEELVAMKRTREEAQKVADTRAKDAATLDRELAIGRELEQGKKREAELDRAKLQVADQYAEKLKAGEITQAQFNELERQAVAEVTKRHAAEDVARQARRDDLDFDQRMQKLRLDGQDQEADKFEKIRQLQERIKALVADGALTKSQGDTQLATGTALINAQAKKDATAGAAATGPTWDEGVRPGHIDGRSQRTIGLGGDELVKRGIAQPGAQRDALGTVRSSPLDQFAEQTAAQNATRKPTAPGAAGGPTGKDNAAEIQKAYDAIAKQLQAMIAAEKAGSDKEIALLQSLKAAQAARDAKLSAELQKLAAQIKNAR